MLKCRKGWWLRYRQTRSYSFFKWYILLGLLCCSNVSAEAVQTAYKAVEGNGNDQIVKILVYDDTYLLVAGDTDSPEFEGIEPDSIVGKRGRSDIFLALVEKDTLAVKKALVIGGSLEDRAHALYQDKSGRIFIAGSTFSPDFPHGKKFGSPSADGLKSNIVLMQCTPELDGLEQSWLIGGEDYDYPDALTGREEKLFLAGHTASQEFPVSADAYNSQLNIHSKHPLSYGFDAFVFSFDLATEQIYHSTFLSGEEDEFVAGLDFDRQGKIIIAGYTLSSDYLDIHIPESKFSGVNPFVVSLDNNLQTKHGAFILQKSNHFYVKGMFLDKDGSVWLVGHCTGGSLRSTPGGIFGRHIGGAFDAFILHINASLDTVLGATYFGGSNNDFAQNVEIDEDGKVLVGGFTDSFTDFPMLDTTHIKWNKLAHYDTYLTKLSPSLDKIEWVSMQGRNGYEIVTDMVREGSVVYQAGYAVMSGKKKNMLIEKTLYDMP